MVPDVGPVANDDGGSPVGVGVETAVPTPEPRLALAVVGVAGLRRRERLRPALRRNGDGVGMPSLAASVFPLAEDPPLAGVHAVNQRPVNMVVNALVQRIDNVLEVRGLHQVAVAEDLGCDLFGFAERSSRVVAVADYQYRQASAVVRSSTGSGANWW